MFILRSTMAATLALAFLAAAPAAAQFAVPDCQALGPWAERFNRQERWAPNTIGSRISFYAHFMTTDAARLFGKPVLQWTPEESRSLDKPMLDCAQAVSKAGNRELRAKLQELRINAVQQIPGYLTTLPQTRQAASAAASSLEAASPSLPLLAYFMSLRDVASSQQGYNAASQRAGQVSGPAQAPARALMTAMRDLPTAEITAVAAPLTGRVDAMRQTVKATLLTDIGTTQASLPGLQTLDRVNQALRQQYSGVLGPEVIRELDRAVVARKTAIGNEITDDIVGQIAQSSKGADGFASIDQLASAGLPAGVLSPDQAARVQQAAQARRALVADGLFKQMSQALAKLPQADESLDTIDREVLPMIQNWPASANEHKERFQKAAAERRTEIVGGLNRSESGSLRGRVYQGADGTALEFVDRTRVFVKVGDGQTLAGTFTEERDNRVVVMVNNESFVLTREGKRLAGGPTLFKRAK